MNTKNNRRTRDTDERIIRAVYEAIVNEKKKIFQITVREVCEKAGINRSTFYAHYLDVFDVIEKTEKHMSEGLTRSFLEALDRGEHIDGCFINLFEYIKKYREFYRYYLNETNHTGVISLAWDLIRDRTQGLKPEMFGMSSDREMEYSGAFFLYGITAIIRLWLDSGCRETPEELLELVSMQVDGKRMRNIVW